MTIPTDIVLDPLSDTLKLQIQTFAEILRGGGVVAFPTETVYGLGASAWNPAAVSRVFELKGRPADNPLIVHICSYGMLLRFAAEIPDEARLLMQKFWPGPLTLVFHKRAQVLDAITAGLNSVAVRMPDNELALKLIHTAGPLVAPSANKSGRPSPTRAVHVREDFGQELAVLDGGPCQLGVESTVLDVRKKPFRILRPGSVTPAEILEKTGIEVIDSAEGSEGDQSEDDLKNAILTPDGPMEVVSPGMKYTHYAPATPVRWMTRNEEQGDGLQPGTLYLVQSDIRQSPELQIIHFGGDLDKMARELYDWFRKSDISHYSEIAIQKIDSWNQHRLYRALINRITKAMSR